MKTVKYTEGCEVTLLIPAKVLDGFKAYTIDANKVSDLTGYVSLHGSKTVLEPQVYDGNLAFPLPSDLPAGAYVIGYSLKYNGIQNAGILAGKLEIVKDNGQSNWGQLLTDGTGLLDDQIYIAGVLLSDEELERLKAEYAQAIADAETAKEEAEAVRDAYIAKAAALDGVAKEENATANTKAILAAIPSGTEEKLTDILDILSPKVTLVNETLITPSKNISTGEKVAEAYIPGWNRGLYDPYLYVLRYKDAKGEQMSNANALVSLAYKGPYKVTESDSSKKEPIISLGIAIAKRTDAGGIEYEHVSVGSDYTRIYTGMTYELSTYKMDLSFSKSGLDDALADVF